MEQMHTQLEFGPMKWPIHPTPKRVVDITQLDKLGEWADWLDQLAQEPPEKACRSLSPRKDKTGQVCSPLTALARTLREFGTDPLLIMEELVRIPDPRRDEGESMMDLFYSPREPR